MDEFAEFTTAKITFEVVRVPVKSHTWDNYPEYNWDKSKTAVVGYQEVRLDYEPYNADFPPLEAALRHCLADIYQKAGEQHLLADLRKED